jgi:hypothetical protein
MSRIKSMCMGSRKRRVASVATLLVLAVSGTAFAAWVYLSGASGSGSAKGGQASMVDAVRLTPSAYQSGDELVTPDVNGGVYVTATNDSAKITRILTLNATGITSDKPGCAAGVVFQPSTQWVGASASTFNNGQTVPHLRIGSLDAPTDWDPSCGDAALTVTFAGTTQP